MTKKPEVTKTNHPLPFGALSPEQFETVCLWLVEREGYVRPEHLGAAGSEQGRDVIAYRATTSGEQLWYFQCKRYQTISAATLIKEVEKYNDLVAADPTKKPFGIVFVTNATLAAAAREKVREFCGQHGYASEFWARTELDMRVKKHQDIVAEFFNIKSAAADRSRRIKSKGSRGVIIDGDASGITIITGDGNIIGAKPATSKLPQSCISISRLPTSGPELFGRDAELQLLDSAWANPNTHIITFIAWGGVGKTALVNHWLKQRMARENYRGAERVYGWSFYSQGTSERAASADLFIDQALRWFGDTDPTAGSPWDKGERLAGYLQKTRTLLVLDGLEPLQYPPGYHEGRLKDAAMQALLVELAARQSGLCVISTRERVSDLSDFENSTVVQVDLDQLTPQAGAQLLRAQHVTGEVDELEQAATEYAGHALALTLLGSYLADVYGGDIRRRNEIESLEEDERHGRHAEKVMRAYEKWLGEGVELAVLRLLGLFDRPADGASITALRAAPSIPGLTEALQNLKEQTWKQALAKLRRIKLLGAASASEPDTLDAHPLVREHFKQQLKRERPDAWREANNRLYEHLMRTTKEFPDTVEEMSPLFAAISPGCAAGRYQEVLENVFWYRIRGGIEAFSIHKLGAFGTDLAALSCFFILPWLQPVADLDANWKRFVLGSAGYDLRALGRLQEAIEPMQAALEIAIAIVDLKNAAINAQNLSELYLTVGDLQHALRLAQQGVELADKSGEEVEQRDNRTTMANILYQTGRAEEAAAAFRNAEMMQRQWQPEYPFLYSAAGFWYCNLLLDQRQVLEVKRRATRTLGWARQHRNLIDIALINCLLGQTLLLESQQVAKGDTTQAAEYLQCAVDGLRQAGMMDYLPLGLLARAALHRFSGDYERAERDLAEVLRIATRSGMGLYLVDYHLESARLHLSEWTKPFAKMIVYSQWKRAVRESFYQKLMATHLAQGNRDKAREHLATAREMIERMGYHRRDDEVRELAEQL